MPSHYYTCPPRLSHFPMALLSLWSPDPLCFLHFSFSFSQRSFEEFAICTYHARIVIDNSSMLHVCIRIFLFVISINAKMRKNFNVKKKASIIFSGKLLNSYAIFKKFWSMYWVLYLQTFCSQIDNTSNQKGFIEGNFKKYLIFESLLLKVVPGTKYTTLIDLWGLAWQVIVHILQAWYSVLCKQGLIERCTWVLELHEVTREWTLPSSRAKRRR